ncbi:PRC-barrel domain-containing protein [Gloeobacter kilaueensis]|uniref:PRC-barrel domain-containing protein n=1 Tax=Gloeobacter kilaueensis (strain ATCC BAA-2537 / CCAP 1431/1 / ULC 316 / JS1) TaxID=1183438 RepID=U5QIM7_GLOK1|nr:PRC-barrel domain-containing protein [Gloeobacter kilaueensis]AGY58802.1 hypothetical protein GKIL_2556 [Gloeobacter kilaueensis JS1]
MKAPITASLIAALMLSGPVLAQSNTAPVAGGELIGVQTSAEVLLATGYRASKLLGATVVNTKGDKVGKVEDFLVSPKEKVTVAILDVGGFLGIGAHRVAIAADRLEVAPKGEKVVLPGATKDALKALPEFKWAR